MRLIIKQNPGIGKSGTLFRDRWRCVNNGEGVIEQPHIQEKGKAGTGPYGSLFVEISNKNTGVKTTERRTMLYELQILKGLFSIIFGREGWDGIHACRKDILVRKSLFYIRWCCCGGWAAEECGNRELLWTHRGRCLTPAKKIDCEFRVTGKISNIDWWAKT